MDRPPTDELRSYAKLDDEFERALAPWRASATPIGLLFSGGVDSGLLAWELRTNPRLDLLTIGTEGAPDLAAARRSASRMGLRVRGVEIGAAEVRDAERRWAAALEGLSPVDRSVAVALAVALGMATPGPVLCGQGADELFLGYSHFRGLDPTAAEARSAADLEKLCTRDGPRVEAIADLLGCRLVSPYLDAAFVAAARALPIEARLPDGQPKGFFRRWAVHRGLPLEIAERPKRAMQYGSGVARLLVRNRSARAEQPAR